MFSQVYCFTGDPYLVREKVAAWKKSFLKKHGSELNVVHIAYEHEEDIDTMVQEVESMPFLAPFKLVFLHDFLERKGRGEEEEKEESTGNTFAEKIASACERAPESSIIVFISPQPDKRRVLYKKIDQKNIRELGLTRDLMITGLEDGQKKISLADFLVQYKSATLPRDVLEYLAYALIPDGAAAESLDLFLLENELHKLEQFALGRAATTEDVDRLVSRAFENKIFDFTDALTAGDARGAIDLLENLLEQGEDIYAIWGNLMSHFRKLATIRIMVQENTSLAPVRTYLGRASFLADKMVRQAKRFSLPQLKKLYELLLAIDTKLKSGGIYVTTTDTVAFQLALERFILRVSSKRN